MAFIGIFLLPGYRKHFRQERYWGLGPNFESVLIKEAMTKQFMSVVILIFQTIVLTVATKFGHQSNNSTKIFCNLIICTLILNEKIVGYF